MAMTKMVETKLDRDRKPYAAPMLTEHGRAERLTQRKFGIVDGYRDGPHDPPPTLQIANNA